LFDFRDEEGSQARLSPEFCPACHGEVITHCRVCFWPLLVIPRQDIPMCWNCYARLRQDEDLTGEKLAIRKYLFQAALQKNKMLDEASRGTGIEMTRVSQACLLVVDLYCKERKPDTYVKVQPPPIRVAIPSAVQEFPVPPSWACTPPKGGCQKVEGSPLTRPDADSPKNSGVSWKPSA
jgi:hypothetical protein